MRNMMEIVRKVLLIVGIVFLGQNLYAQSGMNATGGDVKTSDGAEISFSLGQVDYLFATSSDGTSLAGVQQPAEVINGTLCGDMEIRLSPNSTPNILYVALQEEGVSFQYLITDMTGKLYGEGELSNGSEISFGSLFNGAYLLKVICGEGKKDFVTFKIIKN